MEDEKTKISMLQYKAFCNKEAEKIRDMSTEKIQERLFELDQTLQEFRAYYQETFRTLQDRVKKSSAELREKIRENDKAYTAAPRKEDAVVTQVSKKQEQAIKAMVKLGMSEAQAYDMVVNVMIKK